MGHSAAIETNKDTLCEPIWNEFQEILSVCGGTNAEKWTACASICVKKGKTRVWICLMCTEFAGRRLRCWNYRLPVGRGPGVPEGSRPLQAPPNLRLVEAGSGQEGAGLEAHLAIPEFGGLTLVL